MRKEINMMSKRKWIMGGLAVFASVVLLTTGFAVWIVGTSRTEESKDINVTVDTASNKSVVFTWNAGSDLAIKLEEATVNSGKIVTVEQAETVSDPLRISYEASTIKYGTSYEFNFKSIQFSIAEPGEGEEGYASVKVASSGNKLTGDYARTESEYTYLAAPKPVSIAALTPVTSGNTNTITIGKGTLDFEWGTFFLGKSPAAFYNEKYADEADMEKLSTAAGEIASELTAMHDQLDGKKIKLVATLSEKVVEA